MVKLPVAIRNCFGDRAGITTDHRRIVDARYSHGDISRLGDSPVAVSGLHFDDEVARLTGCQILEISSRIEGQGRTTDRGRTFQ